MVDAFTPATEMLRALDRGQISASELLDIHLQQIARHNPELNAIIAPRYDEARRDAANADARRSQEESLPLLGLPITIKDSIDVAGMQTVCGMEARLEMPAAEADARAVARLRQAGAIVMGKTNTPPHAGDWQTDNTVFGRTNNPWDLSRTPGGSSGGAAAAVAAGLSPLDIGSDIGGSIRVPAAFCGIFGHRPSDTAVPRSGHYPGWTRPNAAMIMNVLGPLARSADDLELAMAIIAGPDAGEDVGWSLRFPPPRHERLADFRVAILPRLAWCPLDDEIATHLEDVAAVLRQAGSRVEEGAFADDLYEYGLLYYSMLALISSREDSREERLEEARQIRAGTDDPSMLAWARGLEADAAEYLDWHRQREDYRAAYRRFFRDRDILLAPISLSPAFPHDDAPWLERRLIINGDVVSYGLQWIYPGIATFAGQPATAFPVGQSRDGLPIGLQAIGPYLEDRTPIRFAGLLSQEIGGYSPPPHFKAPR